MTMTSPVGGSGLGVLSVPGLGTGFNVNKIVNALLQSYDQPITNLHNEQHKLTSLASVYQTISTDLQAMSKAAEALSTPANWQAASATSSASMVATGTTSGAASPGSVTFTVDSLATGQSLVSAGSVAATSDVVTQARSLLVSAGTGALGFSSLSSTSLALGKHTVAVTQASAAASTTGTTALAASTTVTASNGTLAVTADGKAYTLTVAPGTYTSSQLAQAVTTAATKAGAPLTASVGRGGLLTLSTTDQGSAASIQVTGGTALTPLGLSAQASATAGTDAVVSVDGTATTLTHLSAGATAALNGPSGTITATVGPSGHLSTGTLSTTQVSTGNGSLADVVSAIDGAGAGMTASAVSNGAGGYLLDLAASATGASANVGISSSAFSSSGLGALTVAQAAQDARISLGGPGGPTISSTTDQVSGLLPGLTANLVSVSASPVTLTVAPDASALAGKVSTLVDAANKVLSDISAQSTYNATTHAGGPLLGSGLAESVTRQVLSVFSTVAGASGLGNAAAAGITESKGTLTFDKTAFEAAFNKSPAAVSALFDRGGTFAAASPAYAGQVSMIYAGDATRAGSYTVAISHSATQAAVTG
ncbi:MAG: flagellar filament capping protein FliD, partial [Acidimicrobiales bacterium]